MGKQWKLWETFLRLQNHCRWWLQPWNPWKKNYDQPRQHIKKQRHYFSEKVHLVKVMDFPVVMYGCEIWTIKKAECRILMLLNCVVGEDSWEFLDCKEIKPVNPSGNQSWICIGRTDAEAETLILWPPVVKNWLTGKDPDARQDWRQEKKGTTEDEMVGWCHWLNGHEFEQALGVGDGQGSLACCGPWGHKELDTTEWLNWTELGLLS